MYFKFYDPYIIKRIQDEGRKQLEMLGRDDKAKPTVVICGKEASEKVVEQLRLYAASVGMSFERLVADIEKLDVRQHNFEVIELARIVYEMKYIQRKQITKLNRRNK